MHRGRFVLLAALVAVSVLRPAHAASDHAMVLGYYVPYDSTSWTSLEAHPDQLDLVAAQWATIDPCGGISTRDDQTLKDFAHAHGLQVLPSLFTVSGWLNHRLLTDDDTRAAALQNMVRYTVDEGYDGFDLDLEGIDPEDRSAYSAFVADLATDLHSRGKLLTLAIPAKDRDTTTGWAGAFDYAALGAQADLVTVMAYEYRGPFSGPGSVAPFDWVARVAAFASQQIAPQKLLLGLAFYGYDWNTTSGGAVSLGYPRFAALAEYFGSATSFDRAQQALSFSYTADPGVHGPVAAAASRLTHTMTTRTAPACDLAAPAGPAPTRVPEPQPGEPQVHQVWLEDSASAAARVGLAINYGFRGVATWRLGLEDPNVWSVFEQWRAAD